MRLRLGRPDLSQYAQCFDLPKATDGLGITFLGVSTLLLDDGESAIMTDGFFSRPGLLKVGLGKIAPDAGRIEEALQRMGVERLDGVLPVHTHYDHALDSAVVAERTGGVLIGGESAMNIGRGHGLPEGQLRRVASGDSVTLGNFTVTWIESDHCPPDRYPGTIDAPLVAPAKTDAYRCGEAWSLLIEHSSDRTVLVQGSAGFVPSSLAGHSADVAYIGVGQLGIQSEQYIRDYWAETVQAVGAREAVAIHWDDFFRPLDVPLRALPFAGDDLDVTMRVLTELASAQGVDLHFPSVWERQNPWAAIA